MFCRDAAPDGYVDQGCVPCNFENNLNAAAFGNPMYSLSMAPHSTSGLLKGSHSTSSQLQGSHNTSGLLQGLQSTTGQHTEPHSTSGLLQGLQSTPGQHTESHSTPGHGSHSTSSVRMPNQTFQNQHRSPYGFSPPNANHEVRKKYNYLKWILGVLFLVSGGTVAGYW